MIRFTNKQTWAKSCSLSGAVNLIAELTTYTDIGQEHMLEYAVGKGNRGLSGYWHPVKNEGFVFNQSRNMFSTKDRKFVQDALSKHM